MMPKFVIGGVEHSGTTLLSDIFRQVPGIDSGFEVGVLLCNTPRDFRTFNPYINQMYEGWGLTDEDLDYICDTDSFEIFYERLYERSRVIRKPCEIFDKTPRYAWGIERCISNYPDGKYILTYKDPRALFYSNYKRHGKNMKFEDFLENNLPKLIRYWLKIYTNYQKIKKGEIQGNFLIVSLEEMTFDCRRTFERIFEFIGLKFNLEYLLLKNLRYHHTRADYISAKIVLEYRLFLTKEEIKLLEEKLAELNDWFYEI